MTIHLPEICDDGSSILQVVCEKVSQSRRRLSLVRKVQCFISAVVAAAVGDDGMSAVIVCRESVGEFCECVSESPIRCIGNQRLLPIENYQPDDNKPY
jgi:hypothetical protein